MEKEALFSCTIADLEKLIAKKQRRVKWLEQNTGKTLLAERHRLMQEAEEIIVSKKISQKLDRLIEIDIKVRQLNKKLSKFWPENSYKHFEEKCKLKAEIDELNNTICKKKYERSNEEQMRSKPKALIMLASA